MSPNFQTEFETLKREIRDLKTAVAVPSLIKTFSIDHTHEQGLAKGFHRWTIHYASTENPSDPISFNGNSSAVLQKYDSVTNTQKVIEYAGYDGALDWYGITIISTRPIESITFDY